MVKCKGGVKTVEGGALYVTAMIICKGVCKRSGGDYNKGAGVKMVRGYIL